MKEKYSKVSHFILLFFVGYGIISQTLISTNNPFKQNEFTKFITGPPELNVYGDFLVFELSTSAQKVELHFKEQINELGIIRANNKNFDVNISSNKKNITISNKTGELQNELIKVSLAGVRDSGMPINRQIDYIKLGNNKISIYDFYYHSLNLESSKISIYYPFSLDNISHWLARSTGIFIVSLIKSILIILFLCQISIFLLLYKKFPKANAFFQSPDSNNALTWIDKVSENFAIYLGFLGTIVSLWVSLELSTINFQSFGNVLSVMKAGIFTTVLGLSVRIICTARGEFYKIPSPTQTKSNEK